MDRYRVRDWEPTGWAIVGLNLGGLGLAVLALVGYAGIWSAATGASGGTLTWKGLLIVLVITFALMAVHEGIHGVAARRFGGTPQYGATMIGKLLPAFYCTSPGTRFTKQQFMVIAMAPALVLVPATAVGVALLPHGGWLVVPAAFHLGGCIGDFMMTLIVAKQSSGTLVEDRKSSMRLYLPAGDAVSSAM